MVNSFSFLKLREYRHQIRGSIYDLFLKDETGSEFERFSAQWSGDPRFALIRGIISEWEQPAGIDGDEHFNLPGIRQEPGKWLFGLPEEKGSLQRRIRTTMKGDWHGLRLYVIIPCPPDNKTVILCGGQDKVGLAGPVQMNSDASRVVNRYVSVSRVLQRMIEVDCTYELHEGLGGIYLPARSRPESIINLE